MKDSNTSVITNATDIPNIYSIVSGKNCGNINLAKDELPWELSSGDIITVSYTLDEKSYINVPAKRLKPPITYPSISSVRLL